MVIDRLGNASLYFGMHTGFEKAFDWLNKTDLLLIGKGKYELDGSALFAIVNEYDSIATDGEQMESHKKYIDIQYIVAGEELIGHDLLLDQTPSKAYDAETDFMLFPDKPAFFSKLNTGMFAIFYPTDLHMPNIMVNGAAPVKKVVIKVAVA